MGRTETPLDPNSGPLTDFAAALRELRRAAGNRSYRELARKAHYSASTLSIAASGKSVPSLPVVQAYVRVCGGDVEEWTERWRAITGRPADPEWDGTLGRTQTSAVAQCSVARGARPVEENALPQSGSGSGPSRWLVAALALVALVAATGAVVMESSAGGHHMAAPAGRVTTVPRPNTAAPLFSNGIFDEITGPGCPSAAGAYSAAQTGGDGWSAKGVGGGLPACGGAALATRTTGSVAAVRDTYTWIFRPGKPVTCTLEVYVAAADPSSAIARYDVYPATISIDSRIDAVQLDQAPHHGQWITVGTYKARDGVLQLRLTDQSAYDGAAYHVTASAAEATCR